MIQKPLPYNATMNYGLAYMWNVIKFLYTFCQVNMRLLFVQLDLESSLDGKYFRNCLHIMGIFPGVKY